MDDEKKDRQNQETESDRAEDRDEGRLKIEGDPVEALRHFLKKKPRGKRPEDIPPHKRKLK